MDKIPNAKDVTIYGISINHTIEEVLLKFRRTESFIAGTRFPYVIKLAPGFDIHSEDKKTIHSLSLDVLFVRYLNGKTAEFFQNQDEGVFRDFLISTLGSPYHIFSTRDIVEMDMFFYLNGYVFLRVLTGLEGNRGAQLYLELWPEEKVREKVKELRIK